MDAPIDPGNLTDEELRLELASFGPHAAHKVPAYHFRMLHTVTGQELGTINLRVSSIPHVELYAGHVGYLVHEPHRGHRFAARSLRLLAPLALRLGLNPLWITCNPDNWASRRTLEIAGAQLAEIIEVPEDNIIRRDGHPTKCRYRLDVE